MNNYEKIIKEMTLEDMAYYMKKLSIISCEFCPCNDKEDKCMKFDCCETDDFINFLKSEVENNDT